MVLAYRSTMAFPCPIQTSCFKAVANRIVSSACQMHRYCAGRKLFLWFGQLQSWVKRRCQATEQVTQSSSPYRPSSARAESPGMPPNQSVIRLPSTPSDGCPDASIELPQSSRWRPLTVGRTAMVVVVAKADAELSATILQTRGGHRRAPELSRRRSRGDSHHRQTRHRQPGLRDNPERVWT